MSETERGEPSTRTGPTGDTIYEADDCRFKASASGTVHQCAEWDGDEYDYHFHPKCGQRLPGGSMWSRVDADDPEAAVMEYDLRPCSSCFDNAYQLDRWRMKKHSSFVMDTVDLPERWADE